MTPILSVLLLLFAGELPQPRSIVESNASGTSPPKSRWRHRTAKRRERTEQLLIRIEESGAVPPPLLGTTRGRLPDEETPTLLSPPVDWDRVDRELDPIGGGRIRPETPRGARKRAQVEAFAHVVSELFKSKSTSERGTTIIDAGSGAGNLALPLAGLLNAEGLGDEFDVLAVDVNEIALRRLADRAQRGIAPSCHGRIRTVCADLADADTIISGDIISPDRDVIVVSLHACGAASDYAMNLAYKRDAPFAICPCCTAKSLTRREEGSYSMNASFKRSGATNNITYPRSRWLGDVMGLDDAKEGYEMLAKVADVGLGPQTPSQQRDHQRRAKMIVELDRLASSSENHEYETRLLSIQHHDPHVYGKGDLLLGAKVGSIAASVFRNLPTTLRQGREIAGMQQ